jgi:hypothetical protein
LFLIDANSVVDFIFFCFIVQVIALLAAFEKKTGSAVDAKILKQRQRMIQSTMNSRLQDTASLMLTGRKDNVSRVSNKDHFTPTLIIVPPRYAVYRIYNSFNITISYSKTLCLLKRYRELEERV